MAAFSASDAAFEGFRIVSRFPRAYLAWAALHFAVNTLLTIALVHFAGDQLAALDAATAEKPPNPQRVVALFQQLAPMLGVFAAAGLALSAVIVTGINRAVLRPAEGPAYLLAASAAEGRQIGVFFLLYALMTVVSFAIFLIAGIIGGIAAAAMGAGAAPIVLAVMAAAAFAAIWVLVRLSLASPATFAQQRVVLLDSWKISRGVAWPLLGAYFLAGVFALMIFIVGFVLVQLAFGGSLDPQAAEQAMADDARSVAAYFKPERIAFLGFYSLLATLALALFAGTAAHAYRAIALEREGRP